MIYLAIILGLQVTASHATLKTEDILTIQADEAPETRSFAGVTLYGDIETQITDIGGHLIAGRSLLHENGRDRLGLLCANDDCTKLRFFSGSEQDGFFYRGGVYTIPPSSASNPGAYLIGVIQQVQRLPDTARLLRQYPFEVRSIHRGQGMFFEADDFRPLARVGKTNLENWLLRPNVRSAKSFERTMDTVRNLRRYIRESQSFLRKMIQLESFGFHRTQRQNFRVR